MSSLKEEIQERVDYINDNYNTMIDEIKDRYKRVHGEEPSSFLNDDEREFWGYVNDQMQDEITIMEEARKRELDIAEGRM
jgi:hypothetical protein